VTVPIFCWTRLKIAGFVFLCLKMNKLILEGNGRTRQRLNLCSDTKYDVCGCGLKEGMKERKKSKLEDHKAQR